MHGVLQCGPGESRPTQNFGWMDHDAFGSTNNWPVCSLILAVVNQFSRNLIKLVPLDVRF